MHAAEQRKANLEAITRLGFAAYPNKFDTTHTVSQLVDGYTAKTAAELEAPRIDTVTAGRVVSVRSFGKASFLVISDGRARIQAYIRKDALPEQIAAAALKAAPVWDGHNDVPEQLRERIEDVILNRRPDAAERLLEIAERYNVSADAVEE